jgi:hypothetical protein
VIKLKAFTILEVLVAMVISTLVIGGSFLAYEMTYKQYKHYEEVSSCTNEAVSFHAALEKDMENAETVRVTDKGLECLKKGEKIDYDFSGEYVLRKLTLVTDTFHVKNDSNLFSLGSQEQKVSGALIDKVCFRIDLKGEKQEVALSKHYGADGLMNELITQRTAGGRN